MRPTIVAIVAAIAFASGGQARGQNDWQYPDPYFGILEIEKSRSTALQPGTVVQPRPYASRQSSWARSLGSRNRWRSPGANVTRSRTRPTGER